MEQKMHIMDVEGRRHDGFKGKRWEGIGKMPEWLKGLVLKTRDRKGSVGSNPTFPEEKREGKERERTSVNVVNTVSGEEKRKKRRKKIEKIDSEQEHCERR